jgi:hypothetical protein
MAKDGGGGSGAGLASYVSTGMNSVCTFYGTALGITVGTSVTFTATGASRSVISVTNNDFDTLVVFSGVFTPDLVPGTNGLYLEGGSYSISGAAVSGGGGGGGQNNGKVRKPAVAKVKKPAVAKEKKPAVAKVKKPAGRPKVIKN